MASVIFRNGLAVDDTAGPNGLAGGGHRVRFVPALAATVETALEAQNWAMQLGAQVFDGEYSAKEYAVGTTVPVGSAKEWATQLTTAIDGEYSAKEYAVGTAVPAGSAKEWATVTGATVITGEYSAKEYAVGTTVPVGSSKEWATVTGVIVDGDYSSKEYATGTVAPLGSAKSWATKTGSVVVTGEYSAKEWAIGTVVPTGSAKDWAQQADTATVDGTEYSAKAYAVGTTIPAGSAKDWAAGARTIGGFTSARVYAENAASSALSALNAPGTTATSTTSNTIPTTFPTTLNFTIQTGKTIVVGMFLIAASTVSPQNYAIGQVTAYNSGTGALSIVVTNVANTGGTGTFANWTLSLTALASVAGAATLAGNNTLTGQNTFNNATAPIITAKLGPTSGQQHTLPTVASDTFVLLDAAQTLTNKTLTSPVVTGGSINNTPIGATTPNTGAFSTVSATGQITSTVATGTAPFVVASTTVVSNLNAALLAGLAPTSANTGNTVVSRDASGNFSAGTITAALSGNATSATTATTATNAVNVGITNDTASTATHYISMFTGISGNLPTKVSSTKLSFQPSTGNLTAAGNVTAFSDERLKDHIETIENALEKVKQIRGVSYVRKDTGSKDIGVIAQEVQKVVPEVVIPNGEYLSVAYGNLVGLLIEAVKELSEKVERLEGGK